MKIKRMVLPFRRKRKQKTNYRKRLKLLLSGKHRLVVRISSKNIVAQIVEYKEIGDRVIVSSNSHDIRKMGWKFDTKNIPACYLVGYLIGKKALKGNIKEAILDTGLRIGTAGGRIYSCLKGAIDSGLKVPASDDIWPPQERIEGKHISDDVVKSFHDVKKRIEQG